MVERIIILNKRGFTVSLSKGNSPLLVINLQVQKQKKNLMNIHKRCTSLPLNVVTFLCSTPISHTSYLKQVSPWSQRYQTSNNPHLYNTGTLECGLLTLFPRDLAVRKIKNRIFYYTKNLKESFLAIESQ